MVVAAATGGRSEVEVGTRTGEQFAVERAECGMETVNGCES